MSRTTTATAPVPKAATATIGPRAERSRAYSVSTSSSSVCAVSSGVVAARARWSTGPDSIAATADFSRGTSWPCRSVTGGAQQGRGRVRRQQQRAPPELPEFGVAGEDGQVRGAQHGIGRPVRAPGLTRLDDAGDPHLERGAFHTGETQDGPHLDVQVPGRLGGDGALHPCRRRGHGVRGPWQPAFAQLGMAAEGVLREEVELRGQPVRPGQPGFPHLLRFGGAHTGGGLVPVGGEGPRGQGEDRGPVPAHRVPAYARLPLLLGQADTGRRRDQLHDGAVGSGRLHRPVQTRVLVPVDLARQYGGQERGHRDQHRQGQRGAGSGTQPGTHPGGAHPRAPGPVGHLTHLPVPAVTSPGRPGAAPVRP
ncbi:hypothetical protein [Streptomyces sp. GD-15H]|uniref:hypothetical protein n=1 Tax=Streptomyces sp. GD-15H TaxID=3129112 RepID=UPI003872E827